MLQNILHFVSITVFVIAASYSVYHIVMDEFNDGTIVNTFMLLSLNICTSPLCKHNTLEFVIIACAMKAVMTLTIATHSRLKEFKNRINEVGLAHQYGR